jgi:radical SAM protein with 4Fe4S-binding SPASM domain
LAYGVDWKERHYEIFAAELRKIADFYIDHPDILPCNIAVMQIAHALSSEKNSRWCGAGTAMRCVHMSGVTYPCQMFMPSSAGKDINIQAIFESLKENQPTEDNGCKGCKLLSICATCYGNNFVESGSIVTRNVHRCRFEQIRAKAAAYLLANMVVHSERGYIYMRNRSDAYVQTLIQSIKYINNNYLLSKETSS